jgi:hypothetical protein
MTTVKMKFCFDSDTSTNFKGQTKNDRLLSSEIRELTLHNRQKHFILTGDMKTFPLNSIRILEQEKLPFLI